MRAVRITNVWRVDREQSATQYNGVSHFAANLAQPRRDVMGVAGSFPFRAEPFRFSTPRQGRIYQRLADLVSPGAAEFYRDACQLMALQPPLATTTHLVGHAVREVDSALRDVLLPLSFSKPQPCPTCKLQSGNHKREIEMIAKEYGFSSQLHQAWLRVSWNYEYGLHRHAHRDDMELPRRRDAAFDAYFEEYESVLEAILDYAATRYADVLDYLDILLEKQTPTKADVKRLRTHVPNNVNTLGYFFRKL